jgi:ribosomal protein L31
MTQHEFDETTAALECAAMEICGAKRPGYTVGSEDVLANFKRIAELTKTSPEQVCMTSSPF